MRTVFFKFRATAVCRYYLFAGSEKQNWRHGLVARSVDAMIGRRIAQVMPRILKVATL